MMIRRVFLLGFVGLPVAADAHHAIAGNYDAATVIELQGEVTDVLWRNPHVQLSLRVTGENGEAQGLGDGHDGAEQHAPLADRSVVHRRG